MKKERDMKYQVLKFVGNDKSIQDRILDGIHSDLSQLSPIRSLA